MGGGQRHAANRRRFTINLQLVLAAAADIKTRRRLGVSVTLPRLTGATLQGQHRQ